MNQSIARIGIVGAGNRGIRCFATLVNGRDDAQVVALADQNAQRMQGALEVLGSTAATYSSLEEMLASAQLDGLVITTPDYLHAEHVVTALKSGVRHVLVDKPLATSVAGCLAVRDAARESSSVVAMGFNLRHIPLVARIKQLIEDGVLGELMLIENREFYDLGRTYFARWNGRREWSGGLWIHKGAHDFDIFNWWNSKGTPSRVMAAGGVNAFRPDKVPFEVKPETPIGPHCTVCAYKDICPDFSLPVGGVDLFNDATADTDNYRQDKCVYLTESNVHDNGISLVEYDNNVRASHLECFACGFTDRLYTIVGDRATVTANLNNPTQIQVIPRWGEPRTIDVAPPPEGTHGGADPLLVDNFIAEIHGAALPSSSVRDGLRAVAVGEAAEIAWREKRSVEMSELVDLEQLQ